MHMETLQFTCLYFWYVNEIPVNIGGPCEVHKCYWLGSKPKWLQIVLRCLTWTDFTSPAAVLPESLIHLEKCKNCS